MTWEYVAGFVDGEGAIVKRNRGYVLFISQTNFEVLDKVHEFIGKGSIYSITKRKSHWKDAWVFSSRSSENTHYILTKIVDKLIVKKRQASKAIRELEKRFEEIQKQRNIRENRATKVRKLRSRGLTYREIGRILKIDFGYARRLSRLGKKEKWWA